MEKFDFLVIGGGIAGLTYALKVAQYGTVAVLCKRGPMDSSTAYAQGGIAVVEDPNDSFDLHIGDTLKAGAGICRRDVVEVVVHEAPERIKELVSRGINFDHLKGVFDLHREGGHSRRRIVHTADSTGLEVQRGLLAAAALEQNIKLFCNAFAVDLITSHKTGIEKSSSNRVLGAFVLLEDGRIETFLAKKTLVATGGAGKIYRYTTNPDVATGDGIAMCFRAGVPVANMEFFQFHPTCLYHPVEKSFLITEAMRGEGAKLLRLNGERFMPSYHELAELAPRDVVAQAIDNEMKKHGEEHVLLDITHRGHDFIVEHFPMIYEKCLNLGIDITKEPVPVVPAAHYCCGGAISDIQGRTNIKDLYVAGETAYTGLHGANRLASNSLLEGLVFGHRAAEESVTTMGPVPDLSPAPAWNIGSARDSDEDVVIVQTWGEIRRFMWNYVGIVRTNKRLERALRRSNLLQREIEEYYWNFIPATDLLELRNLSLISSLVINSAIMRKESRGLHYNLDYPQTSDLFEKETIIAPEPYFHFNVTVHARSNGR